MIAASLATTRVAVVASSASRGSYDEGFARVAAARRRALTDRLAREREARRRRIDRDLKTTVENLDRFAREEIQELRRLGADVLNDVTSVTADIGDATDDDIDEGSTDDVVVVFDP